jgi:hypothetical protein
MNIFVGVIGFEPTTSSSRTKRASRAALHPEISNNYKANIKIILNKDDFNFTLKINNLMFEINKLNL